MWEVRIINAMKIAFAPAARRDTRQLRLQLCTDTLVRDFADSAMENSKIL